MITINDIRENVGDLAKATLFEIVWTSFGIGFDHGMNPGLAHSLSFLTHQINFTKDQINFNVFLTDTREDLQLLSLLQTHGTKELYVSTFSKEGAEHVLRTKFTVAGVKDYSIGYARDAEGFFPSTSFTLTGKLDIVSK